MSRTPATSAARISWLVQPSSEARVKPYTMPSAPPDTSATAGRSRRVAGPRLSPSRSDDRTAAATPIGTFTQKIQCQLSPCVTAPPTSGPPAIARPPRPPHMPTIAPRRSGGKAAARIVKLVGARSAAPTPCRTRAPIRNSAVGATAQAAEADVNRTRPATKTRRRPRRSPNAAAVMMPAADATLYALIAHCSVDRPAPNWRCMAGRAVMTTSRSSADMKKAADVSPRAQAREEWLLTEGATMGHVLLEICSRALAAAEDTLDSDQSIGLPGEPSV